MTAEGPACAFPFSGAGTKTEHATLRRAWLERV